MNSTEARNLANQLLSDHGLNDWMFKINTRAKTRLGCCKYRSKVIELGAWCLNGGVIPGKCEDTIRHEIAHAIAGHGAGHGPQWKAACRQIGANPQTCATDNQVVRAPKGKFKIVCCGCGDVLGHRHRRSNMRGKITRCCKVTPRFIEN